MIRVLVISIFKNEYLINVINNLTDVNIVQYFAAWWKIWEPTYTRYFTIETKETGNLNNLRSKNPPSKVGNKKYEYHLYSSGRFPRRYDTMQPVSPNLSIQSPLYLVHLLLIINECESEHRRFPVSP